ncbi:MAG TPA: hypothetical protein PK919_03375 [Candidatus Aminicenantes bacterium]|nr:hypothetical protein [Candidatus Aminicenantes bacterium]
MKDGIAKYLPFAVGGAIGWLLFHPPQWLGPAGPLRTLLMAAVGFVLLVAFIVYVIAASVPLDVAVAPHAGPVDPGVARYGEQLKALGFIEAGAPLRVEIKPPVILQPFVHASEPVYATAFRTGTAPAVTAYDFVSILDGFRGGLTSNADPRGGTLPAGPGAFRQIAAGAAVETVFRLHLEGVAWLRGRGLGTRKVSAQDFVQDFKAAIRSQGEGFRSAPVRHALIALWRTVTKRHPHDGPLSRQPGAESQVRALQTGRSG